MSSLNWIGIFIWIIIIAYLLWIIDNIHSRKRKLINISMNNKKYIFSSNVSSNNFEITFFEILVFCLVFLFMFRITSHYHVKNTNSIVKSNYYPLDKFHVKNNKSNYLVAINSSNSRNFKQKCSYIINGKNITFTNNNGKIIYNNKSLRNQDFSYMIQKNLNKPAIKHKLENNKSGAVRIVTTCKNNIENGIRLHAGKQMYYYTILKIPSNHYIYIDKSKLNKRHK